MVERELGELKAQLEKAGFSSLSQMRYDFSGPFLKPETESSPRLQDSPPPPMVLRLLSVIV